MDRGRGRGARGRARGGQAASGPPGQVGRPGPQPAAPPQGAWGGRPGIAPQGPPAPQGGMPSAWASRAPAPQQQAPQVSWSIRPQAELTIVRTNLLFKCLVFYELFDFQQPPMGRGSRLGGGDDRVTPGVTHQGAVAQGDDPGVAALRGGPDGGVRGRTNRNEIINTRPTDLKTKKGEDGVTIKLKANYFQLLSATKWGLNQYRVDFNIPIDDTRTRKKLVAIGIRPFNVTGYLFDGTVLYTPNRLHPDPCDFVVQDENSKTTNIHD